MAGCKRRPKSFQVGEKVMGICNTFNVADLALYHPEQALYEDNSGSSSKQPGEDDEGQQQH